MIKSMTGFGKSEVALPTKKISVEVRSLNSKQLEVTFAAQYKDFVENYVLFYLTQIIPSTAILKVVYKPMDTVYGITINNR